MWYEDEPDWHAPHPSDRSQLRGRLLTALGFAIVVGALVWGASGYAGIWQPAERDFAAAEGPVSP